MGRHSEIKLPLITINDDNTVKLEFLLFDLKTNLLEFKLEEKKEKDKDSKLDGIRAGRKKIQYSTDSGLIELEASPSMYTLMNLTKRLGYSEADKKMITTILHTPNDVGALIDIYTRSEGDEMEAL